MNSTDPVETDISQRSIPMLAQAPKWIGTILGPQVMTPHKNASTDKNTYWLMSTVSYSFPQCNLILFEVENGLPEYENAIGLMLCPPVWIISVWSLRNYVCLVVMTLGSTYYNTHEPQLPLLWRRSKSELLQNVTDPYVAGETKIFHHPKLIRILNCINLRFYYQFS